MEPKYLSTNARALASSNLPGHDEHGVVRLVVLPVEGLQVFDGHALDVAAVADRGLAVVVPVVGRGHDALAEHAPAARSRRARTRCGRRSFRRPASSRLMKLLTSGRLRGRWRTPGCRRVAGKRLEVIGAVGRCGAVELRAVLLQCLGDVRVRRRALEDHVFEQVRHARFAVALVPRADEHGQVHSHARFGVVRERARRADRCRDGIR